MTPQDRRPRRARTYLAGFALAVLLTAIPFALTAQGALPRRWFDLAIGLAAILQVVVHLRFFLHLDLRHTPRETILALAFAVFLVVVMIGGSLWIMSDLASRMMGAM